jgi:hypothetical protein
VVAEDPHYQSQFSRGSMKVTVDTAAASSWGCAVCTFLTVSSSREAHNDVVVQ